MASSFPIAEVFKPHHLEEYELSKVDAVKEAATLLLAAIDTNCTPSRETSLAKTKLEECVMWATKSIAVDEQ